jgi:hypothetical protein
MLGMADLLLLFFWNSSFEVPVSINPLLINYSANGLPAAQSSFVQHQ